MSQLVFGPPSCIIFRKSRSIEERASVVGKLSLAQLNSQWSIRCISLDLSGFQNPLFKRTPFFRMVLKYIEAARSCIEVVAWLSICQPRGLTAYNPKGLVS